MPERLPTLYPMPRDIEQYRVFATLAKQQLTKEEYFSRLLRDLQREKGKGPYVSPENLAKLEAGETSEATGLDMVKRLDSNVRRVGILELEDSGKVEPAEHTRGWDLREETFPEFMAETIYGWGVRFQDGVILAYDILATLSTTRPTSEDEIRAQLIGNMIEADDADDVEFEPGKYDHRDKWAMRTVREMLKLLIFADWVSRDGESYVLTKLGSKAKPKLRAMDIVHQAERVFTELGPDVVITTKVKQRGKGKKEREEVVLGDDEKIELMKAYIWRECGGKGRRDVIKRAAAALMDDPDRPRKLHPDVQRRLREADKKRKQIKAEIRKWDDTIGSKVDSVKSHAKLLALDDARQRNDEAQAWEILSQAGAPFDRKGLRRLKHSGPDYTLRPDMAPRAWQHDALAEWIKNERSGVLEVVTGAGKTIFALMAIQDALKADPTTHISILVPTNVLLYQWANELVRVLGVPPAQIGLLGDGKKDDFSQDRRVLVCIVNSAIKDHNLKERVDALPNDSPHFLIADECHRYRGEKFQTAFECRKTYRLGLSATPVEPAAAGTKSAAPQEEDIVLREMGNIFYTYTYKQGLDAGIIRQFTVKYMGVDLTAPERMIYEDHSKKIRKAIERIHQRYGSRLGAMRAPSLDQKLQAILKSDKDPDPSIFDYFQNVRDRKTLIFGALNRKRCYLDIVERHAKAKGDKIIVFHERIVQLEEIVAPLDQRDVAKKNSEGEFAKYAVNPEENEVDIAIQDVFNKKYFRAAMYHSGHRRLVWNEFGMEWFRRDVANVMLSVRALIEGVDVPAANVGIVRASSSSVRQRIQSTGRILRRTDESAHAATMYVIYARDTTDERIFRGTNWEEQMGSAQIETYHWQPNADPEIKTGEWRPVERPPFVPDFDDTPVEVDASLLKPMDPYPGQYAGDEFHVDSNGRPYRRTSGRRVFISTPEIVQAAQSIAKLKGGGKFVVTPQNHIITKSKAHGLVFLGVTGPLKFEESRSAPQRMFSKAPSFDDLFRK